VAKILGVFAVAVCLLVIEEASAEAGPVEIHWADFSATHQECQVGCTQYEWVEEISCWTDGYDQYCDSEWVQVCVATGYVCGTVRTHLPDGDLINVSIQHNATDPSGIEFKLVAGPGLTGWTELMGSGSSDLWTVWTQDSQSWCNWPHTVTSNCDTNSEWTGVLLNGAGWFKFSKAKFLGIHTNVYILGDLPNQLRGGDRVTFTWVAD
jgi:hypothetical protein